MSFFSPDSTPMAVAERCLASGHSQPWCCAALVPGANGRQEGEATRTPKVVLGWCTFLVRGANERQWGETKRSLESLCPLDVRVVDVSSPLPQAVRL